MYRGRPPPRGGYPPPYEGRGPRPPRPYPEPDYRDDRSRPRPPYHHGYHDHGAPDSYRRSPPRRRYPSPATGSHRGGEYWAGGPPRERSPSPRGPIPLNHNLVITVGNELTEPPGSAPSRHHDREYPPRPEYKRSRSRGRSRDRSLDHNRAKSRGRSKSRLRSQSHSPDRKRAKSRVRSQSRSLDQGRAKSRGHSKSCSPDRSRAKSRGRSKSWVRSRSRSCSRSKSRSKTRSRSRSRGRSRGRSCGRSFSKAASRARSKSRQRSRSHSRSVSSSSSSSSCSRDEKSRKEFKELKMARRRKELEEILSLPTKSILKKRTEAEDSPTLQSLESPRGLEGSNMSRVADQLLQAVKGMEPHMVASMLSEIRSDLHMAHRAGMDAEMKEILNLLGEAGVGNKAQIKTVDDIDDEEKFLYGDSEEPKPPPASEPLQLHGLDLYGDVTEEALYGDYPPSKAHLGQTHGLPPGASPLLSASATMGEVDTRYVSRPTISPDQKITVQVSNPAYPPGTEPLEESERQALEEYEKIQDLLKTIGLDLGVVEISKMAARTKERLHGNKPALKTPICQKRYSSGSSDSSRGRRRRSHSRSSSSSSSSRRRSHGRTRRGSWSSDESCKKSPSTNFLKDRDLKEVKAEQSITRPLQHKELPSQTPDPTSLPPHPGVPIPTYPPTQVHGIMPPNYPPPGYSQYGNYLPYMHQQWPPMYPPPPRMALTPQTSPEGFPPVLPYKQPYNKQVPEQEVKASVQDGERGNSKVSSHDRKVSEEQNNESQKQKVLEEREKLRNEREIRMKKKEYLMKELERLRKQQGELLRKKRRERGGHKDPLLQEISHLQEEVMTQISNLRKEHEAAEKKRNEIDKVALILGLSPSDRPRKSSKPAEDQESKPSPLEQKKLELEKSSEEWQASSSSMLKQSPVVLPLPSSLRTSPDKPLISDLSPRLEPFEYYDAGNHWCKNCNVTSGSMFDFFTHLHSKTHRKTLDPYDRPWASTPTKIIKNMPTEEKLTKPAKGSEFMLPVRGFFCLLCKEFYGDAICAEEHVTTHAHNEKYKKQMYENPLYEQRRNLDRQAGLSSEITGKKRKNDDGNDEKSSKENEEKSKHKKEKKKEDNTSRKEEKFKVKKEEEEDWLKRSKTTVENKSAKSLEEERSTYSKKDEDDNYKYSKKDEKYRYSKEEEEKGERFKYSREDNYRYHYRREDDDGKYANRPKYGQKDDEDKYKCNKYSDFRSKYEKERDERKPKAEREVFKKPELTKPTGKSEASLNKPEPAPKPYDSPKVLCGPSPAMRAKLRKQSIETGKPAASIPSTSFGKFTWKKKENMLAKVAEKVAAEFIKEDEAAENQQQPVSVEDSFAKSMAVAKEIAQKLGGQPNTPPAWVSNGADRGRIRPNLPAPAVVLRKTTMMGKPAPLNTFLSIRPQNTSAPPPVFSAEHTKAQNDPEAPLESKPPFARPGPSEPMHAAPKLLPEPTPPVSRHDPLEATASPESRPEMFQAKLPPPVSNPAHFAVQTVPTAFMPEVKPIPFETKPASDSKPAPPWAPPSEAKPKPPTMIKIVSDVAAPGVPESEQTHTVFVKPPPFMNLGDGAQRSEKLKSNLAAAKAQELFGIFYSSTSHSGSSSITKPATDSRTDISRPLKSTLPAPQATKPQPQPKPPAQPQSQLPMSHTASKPDANSAPAAPLCQSKSHIPNTAVEEVVSSETTSQTAQLQLAAPDQSEVLEVPPNQSSNSKPESQITTLTQAKPTTQIESQAKIISQIQTEPQSKPQPDQDTPFQSHSEAQPDTSSDVELKLGPKTRGKTSLTKKPPTTSHPIRQTRSQTRYQTQQQQQQSNAEPESELALGDSELDPKGLDTSDPGSGSHSEDGTSSKRASQVMEITPETLGLPSDMASLDFNYDFNFE